MKSFNTISAYLPCQINQYYCCISSAGYRIALRTWREKAAGPIHALHTGYGIGSLVIPQLLAPFLDPRFSGGTLVTGYNSSCRENTTTDNKSSGLALDSDIDKIGSYLPTPLYPARFVTVYWILAGFSLTIVSIFLTYHVHGRVTGIRIDSLSGINGKQPHKTCKQSMALSSCSPTHPRYAAGIIFTLFFYYVVGLPLVRAFSKFVFSYARDAPCFSVQDSASLETTYFAAITAGRFAAFVLSSFIHMKYILQVILFLDRYEGFPETFSFCKTLLHKCIVRI